MPLCFAYGSNMDRMAMAARCPQSKAIGRASLPRHRLIIMQEGYASVLRDPRQSVHGVLWDIALADMRALDHYEGVAQGLYCKVIQPVLREGGGSARALVYIGRSSQGGQARPGYVQGILAAAREWDLPEPYLRQLQALSTGMRLSGPNSAQGKASEGKASLGKISEGKASQESLAGDGPVKGVRARYSSPLGHRN
jgi:gamma-glutamylcyclotransferase (GGCT)/AIG2-like uncharacterized protein YtfP